MSIKGYVKNLLNFVIVAIFVASVIGSFLTGMALRSSMLNLIGVETTYKATSIVGRLFMEMLKL
jgi:hypothetical protein